jgi:hypothetical protein
MALVARGLAPPLTFLSLIGKIMVTKAILSLLPTFYLCTLKLAVGANLWRFVTYFADLNPKAL